jgi:hypothetical protein
MAAAKYGNRRMAEPALGRPPRCTFPDDARTGSARADRGARRDALEGENADELEEPAPAVTLTAAGEGHAAASADQAETQPVGDVQAPGVDDKGAPTWLAALALAVGALGLGVGAVGLMRGRRQAT